MGSMELPIGLAVIAAILFGAAGINLLTKQIATISGVLFTTCFYAVFAISEHASQKRNPNHQHIDEFQLLPSHDISDDDLGIRPGSTLVAVRDYNTLHHLDRALDQAPADRDVVVMTARLLTGPESNASLLDPGELFTDYEQLLFTRVVAVAERHGRTIKLLIVPSVNVFDAIVQTAARLGSTTVVLGDSRSISAGEQARLLRDAKARLDKRGDISNES
jgi:hypothetical protein